MRLGYSLPAPPTPRSHSTLFAVLGRVILRVRIDLSTRLAPSRQLSTFDTLDPETTLQNLAFVLLLLMY